MVAELFEKMRELALIPGWRNEMFPVVSDAGEICMNVERDTASLLGIKAFGVHVNGFVKKNSNVFLWVGTRSKDKQTFPGMLDHLSAGGLPAGMPPMLCAIKELSRGSWSSGEIFRETRQIGFVRLISHVLQRVRKKRCIILL